MCRRAFVLLIVFLFGVVVGALWLAGRPTAQPALFTPKPASPPEARAAQERLSQALGLGRHRALPEAATAGENAPAALSPSAPAKTITVRLAQSDINTTLATNQDVKRQMAARGVQSAQFQFTAPNTVTTYGKMLYHGAPADVEVVGSLGAAPGGGLLFTAQSVKVGDLPVPLASARDAVDRAASMLLAKAAPVLPLKVEQVSVQG